MTLIQKFSFFLKRNRSLLNFERIKKYKIINLNLILFSSTLIFFLAVFLITTKISSEKNRENLDNLKEISKTSEFSTLKNFFISKISSPYEEKKYVIKNNDSIEKILKNFNIKSDDIKKISVKLKQRKLKQKRNESFS